MNLRTVRNRQHLLCEGYSNNSKNNNNNNNYGFVSQDPPWEAISYLSVFVLAGLQGKKTHTHKVLWEKFSRRGGVQDQISLCSENKRGGTWILGL